MCAIFGTIGKSNLDLLKEISRKQIFRGPDEQNFFVSKDNLVSFGNNRLSVIDKENGKQPMLSHKKRFVTVFNGCIYNFHEIKKFLEKKGVLFNTKSDTEVVANSFEFFGPEAFNYFDGMWAIAIYDQENKRVALSRDYVGQKPLYYTKSKDYFIFSSQLDTIFLDKNITKKISKNSLKDYYSYSHVPAPNTLFENIYQLEPGENIFIDSQNLEIKKNIFWDLKNGPDYNIFFKKTTKSDFNNNFEKVIYEHSISDKAPALCLSGGIDSYIIMKHLSKLKKDFSSFTLGFENKTFDETKHVKMINAEFKKNIFYTNYEDLKKNFIELMKNISDPIGDSSILPTFIIHKNIKKYSNVAIGGDGGDESFFGYITFDAFNLAIKIKKFIPSFIFKIIYKITNLQKISYDYITFSTKIRKFFGSINLDKKYLLPSWMGCLNIHDMKKLFNENINEDDIFNSSNKLFSKEINSMRSSQLYYFKFYLPMILKKIDQASMFNSVESRAPFLSKKIINFSLERDPQELYKFFNKKYFLKKTFNDLIPNDVKSRKKHGFAFPKELLLRDHQFIDNLLDYQMLTNKEFFKYKYKNFLNNSEDCAQYLWNEIILNISLQNFNKINA